LNDPALGLGNRPFTRRKARVAALQALYETDRSLHNPRKTLKRVLDSSSLTGPTREFAVRLVEGVLENREKTDKIMAALAPAWPVKQIADIDKNILRLAIFEILESGETPPKVAINEAVDLGKIFGSENSSKFINGVLGSLMEHEQVEA